MPLFLLCFLFFVLPCISNFSKPSDSTPLYYLTNSIRPKRLFPFGMATATPDALCVAYGFHSSIAASKFCVFNNFTAKHILQDGSPNYMCIFRYKEYKEENSQKSDTSCSEKLWVQSWYKICRFAKNATVMEDMFIIWFLRLGMISYELLYLSLRSMHEEGFWSYILCRKVAREERIKHISWKFRVVV
jgi:hypothetical protein